MLEAIKENPLPAWGEKKPLGQEGGKGRGKNGVACKKERKSVLVRLCRIPHADRTRQGGREKKVILSSGGGRGGRGNRVQRILGKSRKTAAEIRYEGEGEGRTGQKIEGKEGKTHYGGGRKKSS